MHLKVEMFFHKFYYLQGLLLKKYAKTECETLFPPYFLHIPNS